MKRSLPIVLAPAFALMLAACHGAAAGPDPSRVAIEDLVQGEWVVEDINKGGVIDASRLTLAFDVDGRVSGSGGCNRFTGSYKVAARTVYIAPLAATRRACLGEALNLQEARYLAALSGEMTASLTPDGALVLEGDGGSVLARLGG